MRSMLYILKKVSEMETQSRDNLSNPFVRPHAPQPNNPEDPLWGFVKIILYWILVIIIILVIGQLSHQICPKRYREHTWFWQCPNQHFGGE
jgi:hypothetical protein